MKNSKAKLRYTKASTADPLKDNEKVGQVIRRVREINGITQEQLADRVNFCRNTVIQIEVDQRKRAIPLKTIYKVIKVVAVSMTLDEFLDLCELP